MRSTTLAISTRAPASYVWPRVALARRLRQHLQVVDHDAVGQGAIQGDHHLGDPGLRRADAAPVSGEPELTPDRGLDAVAVEYLALDRRGVQCLMAHDLHDEGGAAGLVQVPGGADSRS